jgi:hypothetical protein
MIKLVSQCVSCKQTPATTVRQAVVACIPTVPQVVAIDPRFGQRGSVERGQAGPQRARLFQEGGDQFKYPSGTNHCIDCSSLITISLLLSLMLESSGQSGVSR